MKNTIGAIALVGGIMATAAAIALVGSAAFAGENRVEEQRAELAKLWGQDKAGTANRTVAATMNVTGLDEQLADRWAEDHRTDRARDHAER